MSQQQTERRHAARNPDEELSPEYLELLEICGGEIRESDRAVLRQRRARSGAAGQQRRKTDVPGDAAGAASERPGTES